MVRHFASAAAAFALCAGLCVGLCVGLAAPAAAQDASSVRLQLGGGEGAASRLTAATERGVRVWRPVRAEADESLDAALAGAAPAEPRLVKKTVIVRCGPRVERGLRTQGFYSGRPGTSRRFTQGFFSGPPERRRGACG